MTPVAILLVDDHDILLDGIAAILAEAKHLSVIGKAASAERALELLEQCRPQLVLTDISMGTTSGLELTRSITRDFPDVKVIVLTMHDNPEHISSLFDAGAMGYLLKNVKQDELLNAIDSVMNGNRYIQLNLAQAFTRMQSMRSQAEKQSPLSARELDIIRLIAQGLTTGQISRQLFISERTVETHRKNILRKTGVKGVVGLVNYARQQGLIS